MPNEQTQVSKWYTPNASLCHEEAWSSIEQGALRCVFMALTLQMRPCFGWAVFLFRTDRGDTDWLEDTISESSPQHPVSLRMPTPLANFDREEMVSGADLPDRDSLYSWCVDEDVLSLQ